LLCPLCGHSFERQLKKISGRDDVAIEVNGDIAESGPAMDPQMAPMLLFELSEENTGEFGIKIHGEGVVNEEHKFYLIVDAPDEKTANKFMFLFAQAGSVDVYSSSTCERVLKLFI